MSWLHPIRAILSWLHPIRATPRHTVLYVEDNPTNLKLLKQLIARRPELDLLTATNGIKGVELARTFRPDVILMDINMPGLNGFEALQILRSNPLTAHIPVIAISGNALPEDIKKGLKAGFLRYITKPIKVNEFMQALDKALKFVTADSAAASNPVPK